jgi:hypothetical protein
MERSDRLAVMAAIIWSSTRDVSVGDALADAEMIDDYVQEKFAPPPAPEAAPPVDSIDPRGCAVCGVKATDGARLYNIVAAPTNYKLEIRCKTHINYWRNP